MQGLKHLAEGAGVYFVSGVWQGFVLAAAVGLCLRLVPKTTAALRFAIWTAVLGLIAMLPFAEGMLAGHRAATASGSVVHVDARWSFAIAAVWMAVSLFRAGDLLVHGVRLWLLRRRAVPVAANDRVTALLMGGARRVELCTSDEVDRPSVVGFFAPRILIPGWLLEQVTTAELEQIVLHEMEHLRRGDDWLNLLQKLSLVLLPLNPIVLWVERRLCFERELACDDGVLRRTRAPRAYATCLTNLAERGLNRRTVSLALGVIGGAVRESELARRVHRILRRETALSPLRARALTGAVALGLLGGAVGLAHCPQVISFVGPVEMAQAAVAAPALSNASASRASTIGDRVAPSSRAEMVGFKQGVNAPHMTLLTATEQSAPVMARRAVHKAKRATPPAVEKVQPVREVKIQADAKRPAAQDWVVMTSWQSDAGAQMILPVVHVDDAGNKVLLPYAAVPTAGGWFLIQL